jgi:peptidoglycan/xylan/chitin deacetylase (PgdA/CDA1 family)
MKFLKIISEWMLSLSGFIAFARFVRHGLFKKHYIGILAYHHITDRPLGYVSPVATSPRAFSGHVARFSRKFQTYLMKDVPALLASKKGILCDGLIFTFDDGYLDSFEEAAPVLEAKGLHGVFYVTAVPFFGRLYLWNDIVGEALNSLRPENIDPDFGPVELRKLLEKISIVQGTLKEDLIGQAFNFLFDEEQAHREKIVNKLFAVLQRNKTELDPARILMDREQIVDLARRGHEIGAHTLTHARLSKSGGAAGNETTESVRILRENGLSVSSFAYPFGHEIDSGSSCNDSLKHAGISSAVTMEKNVVMQTSDLYLLPRIPVSPHHSASFIMTQFELLAWGLMVGSLLHSPKPIKIPEKALYKIV